MTTAARKQRRPNRTPLSQRNRISFGNLDKNFVYRVVNDKDERLKQALEGGYEFVESDEKLGDERAAEGTAIDSRVAKPVGNGVTGYLMRIKKEWYEEDQAAKAAEVDKSEEAMKPRNQQEQGQFDSEVYGKGLTNE